MKKYILFICFSILLTSATAQSQIVENLKKDLFLATNPLQKTILNIEIGNEFKARGVYLDSSFYYLDKALKIATESQIDEKIPEIYFQLADTYSIAESWEQASDYFEKTIPFLLETNSYGTLATVYNNLGKTYYRSNNLEKAESFFNQSIETAKLNKIRSSIPSSYIQLAELKLDQNKFYEAQQYINQLENFPSVRYPKQFSVLFISAKINFRIGNYELALTQALKANSAAERSKNLDQLLQSQQLLHEVYERLGDYKEANSALKKAVIVRDSFSKIQRYNEIEKMELKLQLKAQENEVKNLEHENRYKYLIILVFSIAIFLIALLIFRQIKISKMTKEMYHIQNKLITRELEIREEKNASSMDAAKSADQELL